MWNFRKGEQRWLVVESKDGIGGPVHSSRGVRTGFQGAHSLRSGLAWSDQLAGPAGVRGTLQAFPPAKNKPVQGAVAHSGHLGSHFMPV